MPDGEVGKSGDGHGGFGTWGNFATGVFIYYDDDDVLGVTFGIRYFVLIGFPAITGCFLCHILDPGPLDLGAGLCGGGIKSQRPGTLNPSTVVARERGRERERSAGWKHAESGTVAVLLALAMLLLLPFCFAVATLLQGRRARVSGTWVREACVRRQQSRGGYLGGGIEEVEDYLVEGGG
jgi:hypothetical protein